MTNPFNSQINPDSPDKIEIMKNVVNPVVVQANGIKIKNEEENLAAGDFLKKIKVALHTVKEKFAPSVKSAHEAHKAIKALENECSNPLIEAEGIVKNKMIDYSREIEKKIREEQKKLEAEAREKERIERERLLKKAESAKTKGHIEQAESFLDQSKSVSIVPNVPTSQKKIQGISYVDNWDFRVVDLEKVPREYLLVNEKALRALAKATKGTLNIPGVEFFNNKTIAARTK